MASNGGGKLMARSSDDDSSLEELLGAARPFLRGEVEVDPEEKEEDHDESRLLVSVLRGAGAGECYHKHGTFLAHLLDTYRILRLWGMAPDSAVARCGLFHSSYSNSYVDLAIFHPDTGRDRVRAIIGEPAERLVHLFCVVPRHQLIHDDLIFHYTDDELREHLVQAKLADDSGNTSSSWRRKLRSLVPADGVVAKHIRTGEPVPLSRRVLAVFVLITIADFSDQYTDYQDKLFRNHDGRLEFRGDNWAALWPGTGKPGLWVSAMSRLAALYKLMATDDQIINQEDDAMVGELVIPPVFDGCTKVLDADDQKAARDLYWEAICSDDDHHEKPEKNAVVEALLRESVAKNPFVGEPHLVLAQVLLNAGRYDDAQAQAEQGLKLLLQWGSSWDKRMSWEGWVSWARVMRDKAKARQWPTSKWGIINLGLVDGVVNTNAP